MRYGKLVWLTAGAALSLGIFQPAYSGGAADSDFQALQQLVKNQQQQLDTQANEIEALKGMLNRLLGQTEQNTAAIVDKADKKEVERLQTEAVVTSKSAKVDVAVYGQINRAGLWADNGDASKVYFVDNIFSSTRMGIDAVAQASDDLNVGGKLEYEIISNSSLEVNQDLQDSSASLKIRHADAFVQSAALGKLSLGQGSTSTDGTAERDLSGTSVAAYSAVHYQAGGQKWYDDSTESTLPSQVKSVIDNMDGLSRRDRVRYDTPVFAGLQFSGSAIEAGAFDTALSYSRKYDNATVAAAVGFADSGDLASWTNQYDGSLSILLNSGFNVTLAGGLQEFDTSGRDDPNYWYGKLGYKTSLFSTGTSAFAVDYGMWHDLELNNDEAQSLGLVFVQDVADWGTEFYIAYRLYALDRDRADIADVNSVMAGARVKF